MGKLDRLVIILLFLFAALIVIAGCGLQQVTECKHYTMRGDCERPFFENRR